VALAALAVWAAIYASELWLPIEAIDGGLNGIILRAGAAAAFLLILAGIMGWRDLGLTPPRPWTSLWVFLPPSIPLLVMGWLLVQHGLPEPQILRTLAACMLAVGVSEELMFRGVLFRALRTRLSPWPAVWITSLLFGSVHLSNGLYLGDLAIGVAHVAAATVIGLFLLAATLRTGSILPSMLFHGCWNTLVMAFLVSAPPSEWQTTLEAETSLSLLLLLAPLFLYSLFLLRGVDRPLAAAPGVQTT
jgi:membrane protease YdiL (CAAX protease family)